MLQWLYCLLRSGRGIVSHSTQPSTSAALVQNLQETSQKLGLCWNLIRQVLESCDGKSCCHFPVHCLHLLMTHGPGRLRRLLSMTLRGGSEWSTSEKSLRQSWAGTFKINRMLLIALSIKSNSVSQSQFCHCSTKSETLLCSCTSSCVRAHSLQTCPRRSIMNASLLSGRK